MRLTDDRYAGERRQFELALRMIGHEARTRTIRDCTGLSDDRIRKLYATYFRDSGKDDVRRRRGKSPRQITRFVKNAEHQLQATTLVALYHAGRLLRVDDQDRVHSRWPRPGVEFGHRLCRAFENYTLLHDEPLLSFEWAWNLLHSISWNDELYLARSTPRSSCSVQGRARRSWNLLHSISWNDELYLARCKSCAACYVQDAYALDLKTCPACAIETQQKRRPGVRQFSAD